MKKIDWYIVKKFLTTFFFSIFLFTIIAVVIDIGEKTDNFVQSGWSVYKIITDYYFSFIPHIIALLFPLFVFITVIFFTSKMAGRSEIVAILASGTSFKRFLRPFFFTGLFLAILLGYSASFIVPKAEIKRTYFEDVYVHGNSNYDKLVKKAPMLYFKIDSFTYAGIRNFNAVTKSGGPFFMYRIKNNRATYNLRANAIRWDTTGGAHWQLDGVYDRTINGLDEKVSSIATKRMNFNFDPSDLKDDDFAEVKLTTPELLHKIKLEQLRGGEDINSFKIEFYHRFATPFSVLILTMIGVVIASRKVRGGSGAHLALGFVAAAVFILMDRFSTIFSTKGNFPPIIAAWLPNIVFALIAIYLYRKAPK
ncbi:MAG TPA: LptF/LptG family permease [Arachidicoccus soli]|uniref:YjgP/YjgQ family permease n=1 Tax=Arachidicoccus soli TaxID=2341117 RepID=A0A386HT77_9BACT|nr:LptF/LptG family permease [Arachidicoccus soli]AYD49137.1 YjgP/YjgQ family permease [Arachidicoccus soli]HEU0226578.1 LptF/LptG family permease [Arachidicoccus soli]